MAKGKNIKEDSYIREFLLLLKGRWYFVVCVIPFILGIIGYYILASESHDIVESAEMGEGIRFFIAAAYKSIRFYVLEYDNPEEICNNFLEIARWTAPIVTISGIAAILGNIVKHFKNKVLYRWWSFLNVFKKLFKLGRPFVTIAFYGNDNYESKTLKKHLVKYNDTIIVKVIEMHKHIQRADLYILFSDDDDNFDFYSKHTKKLERYCRLNSRKEKNRLLSREIVKEDFNWKSRNHNKNKKSFKNDNKYIIMKTEKYSIKDEISDYITLVNLQELGSFKFWAYRWKGIYYKQNTFKTELDAITLSLMFDLYKNKILHTDLDASFIKDYVDYFAVSSIFLNYFINIDRDYVGPLCEEIKKNIYDIKNSFRFRWIKKILNIENNYLEKFTDKSCKKVIKNIEHTKCISEISPKSLRISIIGDNEMAEHLLFTAMQLNIFNSDQKFTYNLFGDWDSYLLKHENLINNDNSENVVAYPSNYIDNKKVLAESDVIIVCDDDFPNKIVDDLLLITEGKQIDLISTKQDMYLKYKSNECVNFYNYLNKISNFEVFVEDNLNIDNVSKAYDYESKIYHINTSWDDFTNDWNSKSPLYRYNYICQEEFLEIMDEYDADDNLRKELNNIRKCRFYDFYNLQHCESL